MKPAKFIFAPPAVRESDVPCGHTGYSCQWPETTREYACCPLCGLDWERKDDRSPWVTQ